MNFDRGVAQLIDHTILKPEATRDEVRAKYGNLSILLYVSAQEKVAREPGAEYEVDALPAALEAWLESSRSVRRSLAALMAQRKD